MEERFQIFDNNDIPDPQVLEAILSRESKFEKYGKMWNFKLIAI